jgi:hypothetical protein
MRPVILVSCLTLLAVSLGACAPAEPTGACVFTSELVYDDEFCCEKYHVENCDELGAGFGFGEFYEGTSCPELGYDAQCETNLYRWSASDCN